MSINKLLIIRLSLLRQIFKSIKFKTFLCSKTDISMKVIQTVQRTTTGK